MQQTDEKTAGGTNNPKVELLISRNPEQQGQDGNVIDLVRLFSTMKKRRGIYLRVCAALILIGMAAALFMNTAFPPHPAAKAIITLNYEGAEEGRAPDGGLLETDALKNTYVVSSALSSIELSEELTPASVADNLKVERILSDETKKELQAISGMDAKSNDYYEAVKALQLVYTNRIVVTLDNGFTIGEETLTIPDAELIRLLDRIIDAFRGWMVTEYADTSRPETFLDTGRDVGNDYLEQLDRLSAFLGSLKKFATARANDFPEFRSSSNGISFADVRTMIDREASVETDNIQAHVYLNSISVDPSLILDTLNFQLDGLKIDRTEKMEDITTVETAIETFKNEQIDILRQEGQASMSATISTDYYNSLVIKHSDLLAELSAVDRKIKQVEDRIAGYTTAATATAAEKNEIEKKIEAACRNCNTIAALLYDLNEELITSGGFGSAMTNSVSALVKDRKSLIKAVGVGVGAGAAAGLVLWFANALVLEFKYSSGKAKEDE